MKRSVTPLVAAVMALVAACSPSRSADGQATDLMPPNTQAQTREPVVAQPNTAEHLSAHFSNGMPNGADLSVDVNGETMSVTVSGIRSGVAPSINVIDGMTGEALTATTPLEQTYLWNTDTPGPPPQQWERGFHFSHTPVRIELAVSPNYTATFDIDRNETGVLTSNQLLPERPVQSTERVSQDMTPTR